MGWGGVGRAREGMGLSMQLSVLSGHSTLARNTTSPLHHRPPAPTLALALSVMFLAAMCAAFPASFVTRRWGRTTSMLIGGLM